MTDRELNIALREMAKSLGASQKEVMPWTDDDTIGDCIDRGIRNLDFLIERDFPSLDFVKEHFRLEDLHRRHVYVDEEVDIKDAESGIYLFLGRCTGRIVFDGFSVGTLYLRHDTTLTVIANDVAKAFVRMYDRSRCDCLSNVRVYDRRK